MGEVMEVTRADDGRLDDYRHLAGGDRRQRVEAERGVVVVEGRVAIRSLLRSGRRVRSLLVLPRELAHLEEELAGLDAPVYVAELELLRAVAGFDVHRGALAIAERFVLPEPEALLGGARRVLVLEGISDHENLGSIFRAGAGLGADAVLLDPGCADPLYRRSVRVSLGHVLHLPFARLDPLPGGLAPLRAASFELLALTPAADAEPIAPVRGRVGLLLGTEGPGLTAATMAACDRRVRIPLRPEVDSLNVAVAAAVALYAAG